MIGLVQATPGEAPVERHGDLEPRWKLDISRSPFNNDACNIYETG